MSQGRIYDFMRYRYAAFAFSLLLIAVSIGSIVYQGLAFGLDFSGGVQIEVGYEKPADVEKLRSQLVASNFENPTVVHFGADTDVLIRMQGKPEAGMAARVLAALQDDSQQIEVRRVDYVGPQVGEELREDGGLGMLAALAVVTLYIAIRFQYKFSIGAVAALIHDVIITLGFFSLLRLEVDLTVLAAVLAVVGYSLNDTIIVFDRVRENFRKIRRGTPAEIINESTTQTLWRTLNTYFTTLLVLLALLFLGGDLIHNFAIALIVGISIGTYSSIYVASAITMLLNIQREDLLETVKGELVDDLP